MTFHHADLIEVWAWERRVGALVADAARPSTTSFEYDPDWVRGVDDLSPVHLPLRRGAIFSFPSLDRHTFHGLPGLIADALPDRFGNAVIDRRLAEDGVALGSITALDRLAYLADRAMGALEFRPPADRSGSPPTAIELADLVVAARAVLAGEPDPEGRPDAIASIIAVGTSAGGMQPKGVVAYHPDSGAIRADDGAMPAGFEPWIVKLSGVGGSSDHAGRVEFAYHQMAAAAGIDLAPARLHLDGSAAHFATRRFDRLDGSGGALAKVHVHTLCGLAHLDFDLVGAHSYHQYLQAIDQLGLGADARREALRRIAFNVAAVNRDDHTKNLAFTKERGATWRLAPAYDLTHVRPAEGVGHRMSIEGKTDGITRADLLTFADRHAIGAPQQILDEVFDAVDRWNEFASAAGVPHAIGERIASDHQRFRPS